MMGNFEQQRPDPRQITSCVNLTAWLCDQYAIAIPLVRGHKDAASGQTSCPGKDFDRYLADSRFRRWVQETLEGKLPQIDPGPPLPGGPTEPIPTAVPKA